MRSRAGRKFSLVVVAEGARLKEGQQVLLEAGSAERLPRLGGIGDALAEMLRVRINNEVRVTVLGHLQRGGSPSAFDRILGTRLGAAAVRLIAAGGFGKMVALQGSNIVAVKLEEAVGAQKLAIPTASSS